MFNFVSGSGRARMAFALAMLLCFEVMGEAQQQPGFT